MLFSQRFNKADLHDIETLNLFRGAIYIQCSLLITIVRKLENSIVIPIIVMSGLSFKEPEVHASVVHLCSKLLYLPT